MKKIIAMLALSAPLVAMSDNLTSRENISQPVRREKAQHKNRGNENTVRTPFSRALKDAVRKDMVGNLSPLLSSCTSQQKVCLLTAAISKGNHYQVNYLLSTHVALEQENTKGVTPLIACMSGVTQIV